MIPSPGDLLTAPKLARMLSVDLKTLHNWVNRGEIKFFRTPGRHLRFRRADAVEFMTRVGFPMPEELAVKVHEIPGDVSRARTDDAERIERVVELMNSFKEESDSSYCAGLQNSMRFCAGAEAKMADGSFTMNDLAHHERSDRLDERHRVLSEVVGKLRDALRAADGEVKP